MPAVKPFRGLRYVPERVELGAVMTPHSLEPRRVGLLLDDDIKDDDGADGPSRRARFRLDEWRRAGILRTDDRPALYALRKRAVDGGESLGLYCVLAVDVAAISDPLRERRLEKLGVAVEPVVASFTEPRVTRALGNAIDRDPDATWTLAQESFELWCIDDESTTARIATLISQATLTIEHNAAAWSAHAAWWSKKASASDDDGPRAGAFALAFLHAADDPWRDVPVGAAMAPLWGSL